LRKSPRGDFCHGSRHSRRRSLSPAPDTAAERAISSHLPVHRGARLIERKVALPQIAQK